MQFCKQSIKPIPQVRLTNVDAAYLFFNQTLVFFYRSGCQSTRHLWLAGRFRRRRWRRRRLRVDLLYQGTAGRRGMVTNTVYIFTTNTSVLGSNKGTPNDYGIFWSTYQSGYTLSAIGGSLGLPSKVNHVSPLTFPP